MDIKEIRKLHSLHCDILNSKVDFKPTIFRDVRCGLKSNIPVCCILFFLVRRWLYFFINFTLVKKFIYCYPAKAECKYSYIPCFICFLFRRVRKLYVCSENDVNCCGFGKPAIVFLTDERYSK